MSGRQENSDLVRSESKREMEGGAFQEILEMISWGRRHSIELTVGMFGVTMIYAFGYMTFSGLPLSLFGVNSGIKVAVLFSLVIITAFALFYLFAIFKVIQYFVFFFEILLTLNVIMVAKNAVKPLFIK